MINIGKKLSAALLAAAIATIIVTINADAANSKYDKGQFNIDLRSDTEIKYHGGKYDTQAIWWCLDMAQESGQILVKDGNYDIDKNGSYDFHMLKADTCVFTRLPGCSIAGDFVIALDTKTMEDFEKEWSGEYYYSSLEFSFPWEIDWLPGDISLEYDTLLFKYNGSTQRPQCKLKYYNEVLSEGWDYIVGPGASGVGTHDLEIYTTGRFAYKRCGLLVYQIKYENPLKIIPKTASVKYSKLKNKPQKLSVGKVMKFKKDAKDPKTYKLISAKKGSKSFKKYFKMNGATGEVTVKKGLKTGTYKVKAKVKGKGNNEYFASEYKTVTFKVKVK